MKNKGSTIHPPVLRLKQFQLYRPLTSSDGLRFTPAADFSHSFRLPGDPEDLAAASDFVYSL
jgi:hypothetical protein